jgi:hypothetical protein
LPDPELRLGNLAELLEALFVALEHVEAAGGVRVLDVRHLQLGNQLLASVFCIPTFGFRLRRGDPALQTELSRIRDLLGQTKLAEAVGGAGRGEEGRPQEAAHVAEAE